MKALLVNPHDQTIQSVELPDGGFNSLCDAVHGKETSPTARYSGVDCISLGKGVDLWVDDEGLMNAETKNTDGRIAKSFFVLLTGSLQPRHIVVGQGVVTGVDAEGDTVEIPNHVKPETLKPFVKFIPQVNAEKAAELCQRVLELTGVMSDEVELQGVQKKYASLMAEALALCDDKELCNCDACQHGDGH